MIMSVPVQRVLSLLSTHEQDVVVAHQPGVGGYPVTNQFTPARERKCRLRWKDREIHRYVVGSNLGMRKPHAHTRAPVPAPGGGTRAAPLSQRVTRVALRE